MFVVACHRFLISGHLALNEHLERLEHDLVDVNCLQSPCLPSPFFSFYGHDWACFIFGTTSSFCSCECLLLLISKDCEQWFQVYTTLRLFAMNLISMIERQDLLHETTAPQKVPSRFLLHRHRCLFPRVEPQVVVTQLNVQIGVRSSVRPDPANRSSQFLAVQRQFEESVDKEYYLSSCQLREPFSCSSSVSCFLSLNSVFMIIMSLFCNW